MIDRVLNMLSFRAVEQMRCAASNEGHPFLSDRHSAVDHGGRQQMSLVDQKLVSSFGNVSLQTLGLMGVISIGQSDSIVESCQPRSEMLSELVNF